MQNCVHSQNNLKERERENNHKKTYKTKYNLSSFTITTEFTKCLINVSAHE